MLPIIDPFAVLPLCVAGSSSRGTPQALFGSWPPYSRAPQPSPRRSKQTINVVRQYVLFIHCSTHILVRLPSCSNTTILLPGVCRHLLVSWLAQTFVFGDALIGRCLLQQPRAGFAPMGFAPTLFGLGDFPMRVHVPMERIDLLHDRTIGLFGERHDVVQIILELHF